jgi:hypothetical protein
MEPVRLLGIFGSGAMRVPHYRFFLIQRCYTRSVDMLLRARDIGIAVAIFVPIFTAMFLVCVVAPKSAQREPYLKRVAKKYSIPPLDLR